jgi:hypothetical protein
MIGALRCVSCYNRQREFISGRNANGTPPSIVLKPARIGLVIHPGEASEVVIDIAEVAVLDTIELAVAALRVVDGSVAFARPRSGDAIDLVELRPRHGPKRKPKPRKPMPRRRAGRVTWRPESGSEMEKSVQGISPVIAGSGAR